jgi:site-specific DNA-methyltransferase (adenine-specific)
MSPRTITSNTLFYGDNLPMLNEAASAGYYRSPGWGRDYPRIQILTIAGLLHGGQVQMPPAHGTFKQAQRVQTAEGQQLGFDVE